MRGPLALIAALSLAGLAGCSTTSATNLDSFITTLSNTNCHVTGTFTAQVGAANLGSGGSLATTIDCPNGMGAKPPPPVPAH